MTEKQRIFVERVGAGDTPQAAAKMAGYSSHQQEGWRNLQSPVVQIALRQEMQRRLAVAAPLALKVLVDILESPKAQHRDKVAAAKTVLDRAGFIAPAATKPTNSDDKPLHEASTAELRERAERLARELAERATPVLEGVSVPVSPTDDDQVIDMLR
ncbi:phage terminase small subunit [Chelatococcus caeni]|uniref:Phage terminase small subunit n=1 Tax=Chelatococcus caeni TaxID=1348468 RepID=A0A840BX17_9HYPH|nr:terminase small subunit [Chelatococcus caeni]MBB4017594.1 phage terminase small subunit [Chelatococcus caeni]